MLLVFVGLALTPAALAQQPTPQPPPFIQPSRPLVSTPAEVQKAGVLQVEYGYDAFFRSRDFSTQQATPLRLRFAASSRLLLDFDFQPVKSQTARSGARETGVGDVRVGFQAVAIKGADKHPALAFAYFAKLPAASAEKGRGSGRVDHSVRALLSRKYGDTEVDFSSAALFVGRQGASGWAAGGEFALGVTHEPQEHGLGVQGEVSVRTKPGYDQQGAFALGALVYRVNRRFRLDGGMRFGLNPDAPRAGVFVGTTVGAADLFKGRK
ncbi:MAG: transporter [Pyrinomonadaceae bacterium]